MRAASLIRIVYPSKIGFLLKYELISVSQMEGKGKGHPTTVHEGLGCGWGGWSTPRPGRFTPEKRLVPVV
jgi:hypothetical protein